MKSLTTCLVLIFCKTKKAVSAQLDTVFFPESILDILQLRLRMALLYMQQGPTAVLTI